MNDYSAFYNRMSSQGNTYQEKSSNTTKRNAHNLIMNSPTRTSIDIMTLEQQSDETFKLIDKSTQPVLVSDKNTFYRRDVLFLPDTVVKQGTYLRYENKWYLTTEANTDTIYPKVEIKYCNETLTLEGAKFELITGKDSFGRPIKKIVQEYYDLPCVRESKEYSIAERSPMPLPDGVINVFVQYHSDIKIPINYVMSFNGEPYLVTAVPTEKIVKEIDGTTYGYLSIRGQRQGDKQ